MFIALWYIVFGGVLLAILLDRFARWKRLRRTRRRTVRGFEPIVRK